MPASSTWAIRSRIATLLRASETTPPTTAPACSSPHLLRPTNIASATLHSIYTVCGWSRTIRRQGGGSFCFLSINDGSTPTNLQVVIHSTLPNFDEISKTANAGASVRVVGELVPSPAKGQPVEMVCSDPALHAVEIYGSADASTYPLAKKKHSKEYLRDIAHLRCRSTVFSAAMRIRTNLAIAVHEYFYQQGFLHVQTPLITCSDCEGAGELFQVTTVLPASKNVSEIQLQKGSNSIIDYSKDFFGRPAYLTVSGQLDAESFCCGIGDVYTFGPTFRAENSHTTRHLAEFWMIEPEMAFANVHDCMNIAESLIKFCLSWILEKCEADLDWLEANEKPGLKRFLAKVVEAAIPHITYTEAIQKLKEKQADLQNPVEWGMDLQTEHERYLCEKIYNSPVAVYNYPKDIKSFYMRLNEDGKTVAAMDLLVPGVGELVGGSQREERVEYLDYMIDEKKLNAKDYWWYRELRQYGTVPHAGFGLGFERLIMMATGLENIRDVIPFPRYPGHADF